MTAYVSKDLCMGCEMCVQLCPVVFSMGDENLAEAVAGPVPTDQEVLCRDAAESCPVDAITIVD
jgi:ferredoxin